MAVIKKAKKIGELLVDAGLITPSQLEEALNVSQKTGARLGRTLVNMGAVTEEGIARALAQQFNISYISLSGIIIDPQVVSLIPEMLARRYKVIPFAKGITLYLLASISGMSLTICGSIIIPLKEIYEILNCWARARAMPSSVTAPMLTSVLPSLAPVFWLTFRASSSCDGVIRPASTSSSPIFLAFFITAMKLL